MTKTKRDIEEEIQNGVIWAGSITRIVFALYAGDLASVPGTLFGFLCAGVIPKHRNRSKP